MVDALLATYVMMLSASFVGFGAVAAALSAGPNQLVIVTVLLMMIAMQYRSADMDF